jgi:beta-aspartyl-peptidase (threonine type)
VVQRSIPVPVIVASENGRAGALAAMDLLRQGGRALDAVELGCRIVEDDPADHSVGYSGMPNVLGDVELDASIMDGRTLRTGAVAAVRGYPNPVVLARRVMEELPHVLLAGRGAEQFAVEIGHMPADQRAEESLRRWRERLVEYGIALGDITELRKVASRLAEPLRLQDRPAEPSRMESAKTDLLGTVNFLARDRVGDLASAVSTSGVAWKYPSRVGDSPLIGAGNYCDNRYGAVACTGLGELAIRVSTARSVILYLKMGMSLREAGLEALRDLRYMDRVPGERMNMVALLPNGGHAGFSTLQGRNYLFMTADMADPQVAERIWLAE